MLARKCTLCLLLICVGCRPNSPERTSSDSGPTVETHYSPTENLEAFDRASFRGASVSIDLCAYSLTDHALADALIGAAAKGVRVRIYVDRVQTSGEISRENQRSTSHPEEEDEGVLQSLASTPNISIKVKHSKVLMHLKSYLVDSTLLRSGSANFSPSGEKRQDNELSFTRDHKAVRMFADNFEVLWNRNDNEDFGAFAR